MSILSELQTKLRTRSADAYKLASLANSADDDVWGSLSGPAQGWVNEVLEEKERAEIDGRDPEFPDFPDAADAEPELPLEAADAEPEEKKEDTPEDTQDEAEDTPEDTSTDEADTVEEVPSEPNPEFNVKKRKVTSAKPKGGTRQLSDEARARMAAAQAARRARERGEDAPAVVAKPKPIGTAVAAAEVIKAKRVRAPRTVTKKPAPVMAAAGLSAGATRYELIDNKDGTFKIERIRSQAVGVFFDKVEAEAYVAALQAR